MYSNEHTLQDLLRKAYQRLDMTEAVTEMEVKEAYKKVVGDLIGKLTWEIRFKDGTLKVSIASPGLRQELWYRRESLMEKINDMLGRPVIKRIVFV
ncbi:MAG: DUF721 domain-containing protein [Bacteroidales bacterium]|nr:DUF721 domain-containing protein [Bacteroidales bacterium]